LLTELAVVVPTFNERDNIVPLLEALEGALAGISYEVIFVDDDSADGTADVIREISRRVERVRVIQRINRRGLASACLEGMLATTSPYIAVLDADLQHDQRILPRMLELLKADQLDVVVGSRNVAGGSMGDFAQRRVLLSRLGQRFSEAVCRCGVSDPLSGFFVVSRRFLMEVAHRVSGIGFKILLDLLASARRPVRLREVPYRFGNRRHGESKLDIQVAIEYFQLLLDKLLGGAVPPSFVLYSAVGAIGVVCHLAILRMQLLWLHCAFGTAQIDAALVVMTINFLLNNAITYRDGRLRGWAILRGLLFFYAACSLGLFINLSAAEPARQAGIPWYFAGLIGLALGSVWNYGVTRMLTWRTYQRVRLRRCHQDSKAYGPLRGGLLSGFEAVPQVVEPRA
jgi:dolichol-phosphate mannosyltransferase